MENVEGKVGLVGQYSRQGAAILVTMFLDGCRKR